MILLTSLYHLNRYPTFFWMVLTGDSISHETASIPDTNTSQPNLINSSQRYNFFGVTRSSAEKAMFSTFLIPPMFDQYGVRQPILMCQVFKKIKNIFFHINMYTSLTITIYYLTII